MAISGSTVWEVRSTGNDNNGGGFVTGASGTDWSQQATAQYAFTGATALTSAGAGNVVLCPTASADMVGNLIHVISGTNFTSGLAAFFEITAVTPGVDITCSTNIAGTAISTGVGANGVANIGGALAWTSTLDTILENSVAGNIWYIKGGAGPITYTASGSTSLSAAGTALVPIRIIGYASTRTDAPTVSSATQPILNLAANGFTTGSYWYFDNIQFTGTGTAVVSAGTQNNFVNCKFTNSSGTAGRSAISLSGNSAIINSEAVSTNGIGISFSSFGSVAIGNYIHDSDTGINTSSSNPYLLAAFNIFDTITTVAIKQSTASASSFTLLNNTIYMAATPAGSSKGIDVVTGGSNLRILNNIITGAVTGINHADSGEKSLFSDFNNFYNNTTNRTNVAVGTRDIALDPGFKDAPNGDFRVGDNMKAAGTPGVFPGGSTSYVDIGAVQRKEDYPTAAQVQSGVSFGNGLTGTYVATGGMVENNMGNRSLG
jgi:hypothetical protein